MTDKDRLQALQIVMQAQNMKLDWLSNSHVVARAVDFLETYNETRGLTWQNKEGTIEDDT